MCSMDLTLCTPIHEMYVVSVPSDDTSIHWVYRGRSIGYISVTEVIYTSLRREFT